MRGGIHYDTKLFPRVQRSFPESARKDEKECMQLAKLLHITATSTITQLRVPHRWSLRKGKEKAGIFMDFNFRDHMSCGAVLACVTCHVV